MNLVPRKHEALLVADSSPLIVLAKIGRLEILPKLNQRILVPSTVWREVVINKPPSFDSRSLEEANWIEIVDLGTVPLSEALQQLDPGETAAIQLAEQYPGCRLLMDERLGRRIASQLGIRVVGTLGLLVEAKYQGLIPAVRAEIQRLLEVGHFLSEELIQQVLLHSQEIDTDSNQQSL